MLIQNHWRAEKANLKNHIGQRELIEKYYIKSLDRLDHNKKQVSNYYEIYYVKNYI